MRFQSKTFAPAALSSASIGNFNYFGRGAEKNYQKIVDWEKVQKSLQFECLKYFFADLSVPDEKKILSQSLSFCIVFLLTRRNF